MTFPPACDLTVTTKAKRLQGKIVIGKFPALSPLCYFELITDSFFFSSSSLSIMMKTHLLVIGFQQTTGEYSEM